MRYEVEVTALCPGGTEGVPFTKKLPMTTVPVIVPDGRIVDVKPPCPGGSEVVLVTNESPITSVPGTSPDGRIVEVNLPCLGGSGVVPGMIVVLSRVSTVLIRDPMVDG